MAVKMKRAYDKPAASDGLRVLVDRLWPRGLKKEDLKIDRWIRDVSPSTGLREWFQHDPAKWPEFRRRYFHELDQERSAWLPILDMARRGHVTLIFSSRDTEHNNAVALKDYLEAHLEAKRAGRHRQAA